MELLRTHEPLEAFVFDMDGTLLDSLPDLVDVTNETLTHFGYPTHTTEEILAMIGNGLRSLILQALPHGPCVLLCLPGISRTTPPPY